MRLKDYDTENRKLVADIQNSKDVCKNLQLLYDNNYGFIINYIKQYYHTEDSIEDFKQLAFLALIDAVNAFKLDSDYQFITIYKTWLNHYFYKYNLEMDYCCHVDAKTYKRLKSYSDRFESLENQQHEDEKASVDLYDVEEKMLKDFLWDEVRITLTETNYFIIRSKYCLGKSLAQIGRELHIGRERVRQRELRALHKLSLNANIKAIALDFYNIGC